MVDKITVNTQSSIRIEGEKVIYSDPLDIKEKTGDADIVFITHDHYDHFSPEDIEKVMNEGTIFAVPRSIAHKVAESGIPSEKIKALDPGEKTEICGIPVETVPAYNINKRFHVRSSGWLGYIVTVGGKRIYLAGDTDANEDVKAVKCDIAMIPIGGTYTMNYKEAAELVNIIKPETVIPIHYGSIVGSLRDADDFAALVGEQTRTVKKLEG